MTILPQDDPTVKTITLPSGHLVLLDATDYDKVNSYRWRLINGYVGTGKHTVYLHRFITQAPRETVVDHINHNKLDARRSNLRICTQRENLWNRNATTNTSSLYKGVCWHKSTGKWVAAIRSGEQRIHLGLFTNEIDAAKAYNQAARLYHGDFARLNEGVD